MPGLCRVSGFRKGQRGVPASRDHREVDTLFMVWGVQELFAEPWLRKLPGRRAWAWGYGGVRRPGRGTAVLGVDSVWGRLGGQLQRSAGPGHKGLCKDAKEPRLPSRLGVFPSAPDKVRLCLRRSTGGSERM